jgi:hypothetical protein
MKDMTSPVVCNHCRTIYDLTKVKVTARFADASCFITPCCGRYVDDREFVSSPAFRRLDQIHAEELLYGRLRELDVKKAIRKGRI